MTKMTKALEKFFSPTITLYWRGRFGTLGRAFFADSRKDEQLLAQFCTEAGFHGATKVTLAMYDAVLAVAGQHDYSIETIGG